LGIVFLNNKKATLQFFWTHPAAELFEILNTSASGLTQEAAYQKQQQQKTKLEFSRPG
jgi:hypothetical protein